MLSSMENHIKHKITRIFRSSFGSCKTKNITDVIDDDKPVFHPQNPQFFSDLFAPKPRPFPSICRPAAEVDHRILFPRPKISDQNSPLFPPPAPSKHKKKKGGGDEGQHGGGEAVERPVRGFQSINVGDDNGETDIRSQGFGEAFGLFSLFKLTSSSWGHHSGLH
nr:transcription repressor ofp8 [Ipomoea batatas]